MADYTDRGRATLRPPRRKVLTGTSADPIRRTKQVPSIGRNPKPRGGAKVRKGGKS